MTLLYSGISSNTVQIYAMLWWNTIHLILRPLYVVTVIIVVLVSAHHYGVRIAEVVPRISDVVWVVV